MRIAALYDIHGNLPALEAVLAELRGLSIDLVIVGGDVLPGPMPRASLVGLRESGIRCEYISGNGEREVLAVLAGHEPTTVPPAFRGLITWTASEIDEETRAFLQSWPATRRVSHPRWGDICFCHATPRSDTEIFTKLTPDADVTPMMAGTDAPLIVCGHTHMQFDRGIGSTRIVNAGSVGMPFAEPGAYWLLIDERVELRRTTYDVVAAAERIRATPYPQAETFAATNVLRPPSEADMLALFTPATMPPAASKSPSS
jgi:predicted phosphodiesterase